MSAAEIKSQPWNLWTRQAMAVARLELSRNFFNRRAWWIYFLAAGPIFLTVMHSLLAARGKWSCTLPADMMAYATIFQVYYLRLGIFFGCVGIFSNLFRGEVLEKTLHYYFLSPVRREVVATGKYLSGLIMAVVLFGGSTGVAYLAIAWHHGAAYQEYLLKGPGLTQFGQYIVVTSLACLGYGSIFLLFGLIIRNPMVPAALLMIWEAGNPVLPALLKKFSVIFYLKSLCPLDVPLSGPMALIAVNADPTPAWLAIPGLMLVSAAILFVASRQVRKMEVMYSE